MIDTLLRSEIATDGQTVKLIVGIHGVEIVCADGSRADIGKTEDGLGTLWWLDIYTEEGGNEVGYSATTHRGADMAWIEVDDADRAMIYDLLYMVGCMLRYGWWRDAVICRGEDGELKLVHRAYADAHRVALDIVAVGGKRYDEEGQR